MRDFGNRVAVKVCGITNINDALACAAEGVEMLGLNFSPKSPRYISREVAAEIVAAVRKESPQTKLVGVFVNQDMAFVNATAEELSLDAVQLHGDESPAYTRDVKASFVIKALRVGPEFVAAAASEYECDAILLDTWNASVPGGTGVTFPWSIAATLRPTVKRLILAGGLTPSNIVDAIQTVRPFAVDVCSGIEDAPGRKNRVLLRDFLDAIRVMKLGVIT
ncbi:MAG: phosphoribosylanthranilate isomerase [Verrucomicrobiota bacterium]